MAISTANIVVPGNLSFYIEDGSFYNLTNVKNGCKVTFDFGGAYIDKPNDIQNVSVVFSSENVVSAPPDEAISGTIRSDKRPNTSKDFRLEGLWSAMGKWRGYAIPVKFLKKDGTSLVLFVNVQFAEVPYDSSADGFNIVDAQLCDDGTVSYLMQHKSTEKLFAVQSGSWENDVQNEYQIVEAPSNRLDAEQEKLDEVGCWNWKHSNMNRGILEYNASEGYFSTVYENRCDVTEIILCYLNTSEEPVSRGGFVEKEMNITDSVKIEEGNVIRWDIDNDDMFDKQCLYRVRLSFRHFDGKVVYTYPCTVYGGDYSDSMWEFLCFKGKYGYYKEEGTNVQKNIDIQIYNKEIFLELGNIRSQLNNVTVGGEVIPYWIPIDRDEDIKLQSSGATNYNIPLKGWFALVQDLNKCFRERLDPKQYLSYLPKENLDKCVKVSEKIEGIKKYWDYCQMFVGGERSAKFDVLDGEFVLCVKTTEGGITIDGKKYRPFNLDEELQSFIDGLSNESKCQNQYAVEDVFWNENSNNKNSEFCLLFVHSKEYRIADFASKSYDVQLYAVNNAQVFLENNEVIIGENICKGEFTIGTATGEIFSFEVVEDSQESKNFEFDLCQIVSEDMNKILWTYDDVEWVKVQIGDKEYVADFVVQYDDPETNKVYMRYMLRGYQLEDFEGELLTIYVKLGEELTVELYSSNACHYKYKMASIDTETIEIESYSQVVSKQGRGQYVPCYFVKFDVVDETTPSSAKVEVSYTDGEGKYQSYSTLVQPTLYDRENNIWKCYTQLDLSEGATGNANIKISVHSQEDAFVRKDEYATSMAIPRDYLIENGYHPYFGEIMNGGRGDFGWYEYRCNGTPKGKNCSEEQLSYMREDVCGFNAFLYSLDLGQLLEGSDALKRDVQQDYYEVLTDYSGKITLVRCSYDYIRANTVSQMDFSYQVKTTDGDYFHVIDGYKYEVFYQYDDKVTDVLSKEGYSTNTYYRRRVYRNGKDGVDFYRYDGVPEGFLGNLGELEPLNGKDLYIVHTHTKENNEKINLDFIQDTDESIRVGTYERYQTQTEADGDKVVFNAKHEVMFRFKRRTDKMSWDLIWVANDPSDVGEMIVMHDFNSYKTVRNYTNKMTKQNFYQYKAKDGTPLWYDDKGAFGTEYDPENGKIYNIRYTTPTVDDVFDGNAISSSELNEIMGSSRIVDYDTKVVYVGHLTVLVVDNKPHVMLVAIKNPSNSRVTYLYWRVEGDTCVSIDSESLGWVNAKKSWTEVQ